MSEIENLIIQLERTDNSEVIDKLRKIGRPAEDRLIAYIKEQAIPGENGLVPMLYYEKPKFRVLGALRALEFMGSSRAVDTIVSILTCSDPDIERRAIRALGEIGDDRAVEPLFPLLKSTRGDNLTADWRRLAANSLLQIAAKRPRQPIAERIIERVMPLLHKDPVPQVRADISYHWEIDNPMAVPGLIRALEDSSSTVRANIALALGKYGDGRALPALKRMVDNEIKKKESIIALQSGQKAIQQLNERGYK